MVIWATVTSIVSIIYFIGLITYGVKAFNTYGYELTKAKQQDRLFYDTPRELKNDLVKDLVAASEWPFMVASEINRAHKANRRGHESLSNKVLLTLGKAGERKAIKEHENTNQLISERDSLIAARDMFEKGTEEWEQLHKCVADANLRFYRESGIPANDYRPRTQHRLTPGRSLYIG